MITGMRTIIEDVADILSILPSWPFLVCVHYLLTAVALRNEPEGRKFAVDHPIASCCLCVLISGSGTIITSIMLGLPVLNSILDERAVWSGVLIWYLVHFSPNDFLYKLSNKTPVKLILNLLEEIRRSRNIMSGVLLGGEVYPNSFLPLALTGMFKGTGKKWSICFYRILTGLPEKQYELLELSFTTKGGFLLGMMYAVIYNTGIFSITTNECILLGSIILCTLKLYDIWYKTNSDPLKRPQEKIWSVVTCSIEKEKLE